MSVEQTCLHDHCIYPVITCESATKQVPHGSFPPGHDFSFYSLFYFSSWTRRRHHEMEPRALLGQLVTNIADVQHGNWYTLGPWEDRDYSALARFITIPRCQEVGMGQVV